MRIDRIAECFGQAAVRRRAFGRIGDLELAVVIYLHMKTVAFAFIGNIYLE